MKYRCKGNAGKLVKTWFTGFFCFCLRKNLLMGDPIICNYAQKKKEKIMKYAGNLNNT